ncbi:MAG TPA: glycerol-3-phosphate 1-O-acyltransferase PlsY [Methylomirabilota bacterium]|nr:glycerol-3-phosphate 1-O-acyltransferase PlsY [Methylomirabilota bacterium]
MEVVSYIVTACVAYLLGSIPTGYLVAKSRGIDIRTVGSGNIGATNVFRTLGKPAGTLVLAVDVLKGFVSCFFVGYFVYQLLVGRLPDQATKEFLKITGGFLAILGHNYTCWLRFKGGKGIATSAGVVLGLLPGALAVSVGAWLTVIALTRYVSLASMAGALVLPFAAWWFGGSPRLIVVGATIAVLAMYTHRTNIKRLLDGTENRLGKRKEDGP